MGRHALRGAVTAWMVLIVLRTVGTAGGSGKIAGLFGDADRLVQRALSASVPAIPDRRGTGAAPSSGFFNMTPAQVQGVINGAAAGNAVVAATGPGGALSGLSSLQQYAAGGLPAGIVNNPALR